jgi:glucose/arabinose dehydrogenase
MRMKKWIFAAVWFFLAGCGGAASQATPAATPTQPVIASPPAATAPAGTALPGTADPASPTSPVEATPPAEAAPTLAPTPGFADPGGLEWVQVARGFNQPIGISHASDGSGRLFVIEQAGRIRILRAGEVLNEPFLDIRDRVGSDASERGLLGLAFHPSYHENGYFYVNYTDRSGSTVIARFQVSGDNPDRALPDSEQRLLHVPQPYGNHNGGVTKFGPDGYLYIGLGDGGSGGDPQNNGQSLDSLLGAVLRIDVNSGDPYAIPPDNPFINGEGQPEIWAYGLRNPWRFSFDRLTGDLYIGDVGQNSFEEINFQPAKAPGGANYGWNIMEAFDCFSASSCDQTGLTLPVFSYPTRFEGSCAVTGGYVYRGASLMEWHGTYIFGDFCSGLVWGLKQVSQGEWEDQVLFRTGFRITSFGEDERGELYLADYAGGIYQLVRK